MLVLSIDSDFLDCGLTVPVCQEIRPHVTSGCVSKGFMCKKQEVMNLCCLELMRQKHCWDLDITLIASDMVVSNVLTNFRGEQNGNDDLWPRLSEVSLFNQKVAEDRTLGLLSCSLLHVQQGGGEQLLPKPSTKPWEWLKQLLSREQGPSCPCFLWGMNKHYSVLQLSAAPAFLNQSCKEQNSPREESVWNRWLCAGKWSSDNLSLSDNSSSQQTWWGR